MARVTITLQNSEREALVLLAQGERRDPRAQAALLIHRELEHIGLLPADTPTFAQPTRAAEGMRRVDAR